jgi:hypothetical protein
MSEQQRSSCQWCGRENENNPGDYYHEKACHRTDVLRRMDSEKAKRDSNLMDELERELARASYVGD